MKKASQMQKIIRSARDSKRGYRPERLMEVYRQRRRIGEQKRIIKDRLGELRGEYEHGWPFGILREMEDAKERTWTLVCAGNFRGRVQKTGTTRSADRKSVV